MDESQVQKVAAKVFSKALKPLGFDHVEVTSGLDQDGERSLFLDVFFKPGTEIENVRPVVDARTELHDLLLARGEERFPYVAYRIPGGLESQSDDIDEAGVSAR